MEPCEFLAWDTDFFGFRVARVNGHHLDDDRLSSIQDWCREQSIRCLYFLADIDDHSTINMAEDNDFHHVDLRITFERNLTEKENFASNHHLENLKIHISQKEDLPFLQAIARESYTMSRFYYDPGFPRERCDALYDTWVKQSCEGYADAVWVADLENKPVGYITCHLQGDAKRQGQIGLVGIGPTAQGTGIGRILVERSLQWFNDQQATLVKVVTQGRNIKAQRLYQRCGFVTNNIQLWYHKWFTNEQ